MFKKPSNSEANCSGKLPNFKDQVRHYGWSGNIATDNEVVTVSALAEPISSMPHAQAVLLFDESILRRRKCVICLAVVLIVCVMVLVFSPVMIAARNKPVEHPPVNDHQSSNKSSDSEPTIPLQRQQFKLFSNDIAPQDRFGSAVAVEGDLMVVGAPLANSSYIFRRQRGVWNQEAKLTGSGRFGRSVAIVSNSTVVVSAFYDDLAGPYSGSVFVFEQSGNDWNKQDQLIASDASPDALFGSDLAVDDSTIVIAAQNDSNRTGCVYVFIKNVDNKWIELQKLTASNAAIGTYFGTSVAMNNDVLVIGAKAGDAGDGFDLKSGTVYVFERSSESRNWTELQILVGRDSINGDGFGHTVAIENNTMAIGAKNDDNGSDSGTVYVFERNEQNMLWTEQYTITKPKPLNFAVFGLSIVLLNGRLLISSHHGSGDQSSGEVFMFVRDGLEWRAEFQLIASGPDKEMKIPKIAADGDTIAVGCGYSDTSKGARSGIVFMYRFL